MLNETLKSDGIALLDQIYDTQIISSWNKRLDPLFEAGNSQFRFNLTVGQMYEAGILSEFFNEKMRSAISSVIPDAVLLSFESYEIAGNSQLSHINPFTDEGWHYDIAPLPGLDHSEIHFLCIFLYLTDVGPKSGGFEFRPVNPKIPLSNNDQTIYVSGKAGTTFFWNRAFYHRASANESSVRRRIIKVCLQHNYLQNNYIETKEYADLKPLFSSDPYMSFLFGEKHKSSHHGSILPSVSPSTISAKAMKDRRKIQLTSARTLMYKILFKLKLKKK